jgi:hypothetical protein
MIRKIVMHDAKGGRNKGKPKNQHKVGWLGGWLYPQSMFVLCFSKKKIRKSPVKGGCRRTIKRRKPRVEA